MISFEKAREIISRRVVLKRPERLLLAEAIGCVLARDIAARDDGPAFDKSVMDGFAVRSQDTVGAPVDLKIIGALAAGELPRRGLKKDQAIRIATGAMLPSGADAVVMEEEAVVKANETVRIPRKISRGESVYFRSRDFKKGCVLLKKGSLVNDVRAGLLSSQGLTRVLVYPMPHVALAATGDEVVEAAADAASVRCGTRQRLCSWPRCGPGRSERLSGHCPGQKTVAQAFFASRLAL